MLSKPFRSFFHAIAAAFFILQCFEAASRHANAQPIPVTLELLAPTSAGNQIPTVTWGGWPLILRMTANREIGIGWTEPFEFPVNSTGLEGGASTAGILGQGFSAIVFEEPDDCHSWADPCQSGVNETYLAFRPGRLECSANGAPGPTGEPVGVASLVVLADVGEGENGANLASHFNNVGYELNDVGKRTNVVASMVVPNGMVTPPVITDLCVEASGTLARFRGQLLSFDELLTALNVNNITTLRAFVVNRTAPAQLSDRNGDGVINSRDAELSGFSLLSREVVFRVRTFHQMAEFEFVPHADLDGNGTFSSLCGPFCTSLTRTSSSVRMAGSQPSEAPYLPPLSKNGLCDGVICDDNNPCTTDTCDPAIGCVNTPIACDDNNVCTTDTCDPAIGCMNTPVFCNDCNTCTDDSCDPATGCVFTDNGTCGPGGGGLTPVPR